MKSLKFKVRRYNGGKQIADVWLLEISGMTEQCLLHGEVTLRKSEELILMFQKFGIKIEQEESEYLGISIWGNNESNSDGE